MVGQAGSPEISNVFPGFPAVVWSRLKSTFYIAAATGMALSCAFCVAQPQSSRTVHVSGYVRDLSGAPVAGASVTAHGAKTVSNSSGQYVLSSLPGLTSLEVAVGKNASFCLVVDLEQDRELYIRLESGCTGRPADPKDCSFLANRIPLVIALIAHLGGLDRR